MRKRFRIYKRKMLKEFNPIYLLFAGFQTYRIIQYRGGSGVTFEKIAFLKEHDYSAHLTINRAGPV